MRHPTVRTLLLTALLGGMTACASSPPPPDAPPVSLPAVMGTWYVIAHVPYFTERGQVWAHDDYALLPDGRIGVHYTYRKGFHGAVKTLDATATVLPGTGNRDWRLRFFRVVPATQRILEVAPDGRWMLLASPDHDLAWIFARSSDMSDATYQSLLHKLKDHGVKKDRLWRIPQTPEQVGRLGFERPDQE